MVIAIDIDGVLRNIHQAIVNLYNRDFNENKTIDDITDWEWSGFDKIDIEEFMYNRYPEEIFRYSELIEDAREGIDFLNKQGQTMLISHQPKQTRGFTYQWVGFNQIPVNQIIIVPLNQSKASYEFDILIDDAVFNLEEALDAGRRIICFGHVWNKRWNFNRVEGWLDLIENWERLRL